MLIGCANELLNQINTNEKIQQYLVKRPFTYILKGAVPALGITSCLATAKKGLNYTNPPSSFRVTEPAGRWNLGIV